MASEQSIYRALKRFESLGVVRSAMRHSPTGPDRRYYALTPLGVALLQKFVARNIAIFQAPPLSERIERVLQTEQEVLHE